MFCKKCGAENPDGSAFCLSCGAGFAPATDVSGNDIAETAASAEQQTSCACKRAFAPARR